MPLAEDEAAAPSVVEFSLTAAVTKLPSHEGGGEVTRWTYNAMLPGPMLRARVGDRVRVHFQNQLPEPTTIHWHGLEVPAAMDGADPEHHAVAPGERFEYEFVVPHAGTYWYHPHMNSAAQVWRGLYGALIVDPAEAETADNAATLGAEAVLILSDVSIEADKLVEPDPEDLLAAFFGHQGNLLQVNGRTLPTLRVRAGAPLHLRFINAAISRYFRLGAEGHPLTRVAGDSGFIARPESRDSILLVPGERAEAVLVPQGEVGSVFLLSALPYDRMICGGQCETSASPLLRIEIVETGGEARTLPTKLAEIEAIDVSAAVEHTVAMTQDERNGSGAFGLNNQLYPEDPFSIHASVGETHVWTIDNRTDYDHPFHLHGFRFQVLEQDGTKPAFAEWKDTLNLPMQSTARIAITFDDRPGMWMLHCHILGHAELGMMGMLHLSPQTKGHAH